MISKNVLKAVLIDLDGTLADSLPALYATYLDFLKERGVEGTREEFQQLNGPTLPEIVAYLKGKYGWTESEELLFSKYQEVLQKHYVETMSLFPGVIDFLHYAKNKGWKLALVTSAGEVLAFKFLLKKKIEDYFDLLVTLSHVRKGKPDPEIYLKALRKLRLRPTDVVAIEDSPNGVRAALAAGIATVQILHGDSDKKVPGSIAGHNWDHIMELFKEKYG